MQVYFICDKVAQGRTNLIDLIVRLKEKIYGKKIGSIISSPTQKALRITKVFADRITAPVIYDSSLADLGSISSSNTTKNEAEDKLQARVIYFLERFCHENKDEIKIVVSHVRFICSLINTIKNAPRISPINFKYNKFYLLEDLWSKISISDIKTAKASIVRKIIIRDQIYIIKKIYGASKNEMEFQSAISRHLTDGKVSVPTVLYWDIRDKCSIQILSYFDGKHMNRELTKVQMKNCILESFKLGERLKSISDSYKKNIFFLRTLMTLSTKTLPRKSRVSESVKKLFKKSRYKKLINSRSQVLVHYDLHRSNILFAGNRVKFLDLGGFIYAHDDFLPASLFLAFFMLNNSKFNLANLISIWPKPLNMRDIIILMWARAIIGASFFEDKIILGLAQNDDHLLHEKYLNCLERIERIV